MTGAVHRANVRRQRGALLILCATALVPLHAFACDVQVYQWALQNWEPDAYQLTVFQRGPLDAQAAALVARLSPQEGTPAAPNLNVETLDVDALPEGPAQVLWASQSHAELPWMVLRYPDAPPPLGQVWAGPLNEANVDALTDSPARREIARGLLAGDAAVWILLESGDPAQDDTAAKLLESQLSGMAEQLKQAPLLERPAQSTGTVSLDGLHFSVVRVSRTAPAEAILTAMLLGSEPDLRGYSGPIAFPVFGRGRALYALVGPGIAPDTIREACGFVSEACTCQVKAENPGTDLLMLADWSAAPKWPMPGLPAAAAATLADLGEVGAPNPLWYAASGLALALMAVAGATLALIRRPRP